MYTKAIVSHCLPLLTHCIDVGRCVCMMYHVVHIIGRYEGRTFEDRDINFVIGEASEVGVIDGIDQAIKKFKKGEKSLLKVRAKYAYGAVGSVDYNIPANADLKYEVELKKFEKVTSVFLVKW